MANFQVERSSVRVLRDRQWVRVVTPVLLIDAGRCRPTKSCVPMKKTKELSSCTPTEGKTSEGIVSALRSRTRESRKVDVGVATALVLDEVSRSPIIHMIGIYEANHLLTWSLCSKRVTETKLRV